MRIATNITGALETALKSLPVPETLARLAWRPEIEAAMGPGLLVGPEDPPAEVWDVTLGRFLDPAEIAARRR